MKRTGMDNGNSSSPAHAGAAMAQIMANPTKTLALGIVQAFTAYSLWTSPLG